MPPRKKDFSLSDIVKLTSEALQKAAVGDNINSYKPHAKQVIFHTSPKRGRLYSGGNRAGKTVGGACEAVWRLTGKHPFLKTPPPPIQGRSVSVDFRNGVQGVTLPAIAQWMPPSELINGSWEDSYSASDRKLTLANGSELDFKSYDQELDAHSGVRRHFCWFDEEPPRGHFEENLYRLIDFDGVFWLTMTPVEHMTWTYEHIYERAIKGDPLIDIIEVKTSENPHVNHQSASELSTFLDLADRKARDEGAFVPSSGFIFSMLDAKKNKFNRLPFSLRNPSIRIFATLDAGINHPNVWLWHAVDLSGGVWTFAEMYSVDTSIPEIAKQVFEFERDNKIYVYQRYGDPAIQQRSKQTGYSDQVAYAQEGLDIALSPTNSYDTLDRMSDYLNKGKWKISEDCPRLLNQMKKYRWAEWDSRKMKDKNPAKQLPHKKDDDGPDSARYLFAALPDLSEIQQVVQGMGEFNAKISGMLDAKSSYRIDRPYVDPFFDLESRSKKAKQPRVYRDDTIGGLF